MRSIFAVARNMIAEGVRMKIAVVFIVMLMVIVPLLPVIMHGDGTLKGRVQTFLAYSLGAASALLCLLTVFLSCASIAGEIKGRQILLAATKPVARWRFLVGKWLGIIALDAMLLGGTALVVYGMVAYLKTTSWVNEADHQALQYEVLTARASAKPVEPDYNAMVGQALVKLRKEGRLPDDALTATDELTPRGQKIARQILQEQTSRFWSCPPRAAKTFRFENINVSQAEASFIHIRYKANVTRYPPDEILRHWWEVGDPGKQDARIDESYLIGRNDVVARYHIIPVPADAVAPDGTLSVTFVNRDPRNPLAPEKTWATQVNFTEDIGKLEVLYEVGSFEANLVRSLLMLMTQLMVLAAFGVLASSFLSFPVACLVTMLVFLTAICANFLTASLGSLTMSMPAIAEMGDVALRFAVYLKPITTLFVKAVPPLSDYNPIEALVDGRVVSWQWLGRSVLRLGCVHSLASLVLAMWIFRRRELAQVIV